MKNTIFFLLMLIVLIPTFLFAETVRKNIKLPDGKTDAVGFYVDGKEVATEIFGKDGKVVKITGKIPDGIVKEGYYGNGNLIGEWNYKDDKREGIHKTYYENGNLASEFNYKDGKLEGISKVYYENGKLQIEWNYKDGKLEGISKDYYENGKLYAEWNYKDDKREGICKVYSENGNLIGERNYKDDKLEGISKIYSENGKLQIEWNYKDGKLEGICKVYYENGKLQIEWNYKDGKLIETKEYGPNGMFIDKRWEFIGSDVSGGYWYIDTKTISHLSGNIIKVWIMIIPEEGSEDYGYQSSFYEIDCSKNMCRALSIIEYNNDRTVLSSWNDNYSKWSFVAPSSMMEGIQKAVCKRKGETKKGMLGK